MTWGCGGVGYGNKTRCLGGILMIFLDFFFRGKIFTTHYFPFRCRLGNIWSKDTADARLDRLAGDIGGSGDGTVVVGTANTLFALN